MLPLFSKYLDKEKRLKSTDSKKDIRNQILELAKNNNIFLISSNSAKKKIKNLGIDVRILIITGGPIYYMDYKKVNPKLPDVALENLKKKCNTLFNQMKKKDWSKNDLVFIYEKTNFTDQLILKRIDSLVTIISKDVKLLEIDSWKDLEI